MNRHIEKNREHIKANKEKIQENKESIRDNKRAIKELRHTVHALIIALIISLTLLFVTNAVWLYQVTRGTTVITEGGTTNFIGESGKIIEEEHTN